MIPYFWICVDVIVNTLVNDNAFTYVQVLAPGKRIYIDDGLISVLTKEALHAITPRFLF
jgi:hypothetical protein